MTLKILIYCGLLQWFPNCVPWCLGAQGGVSGVTKGSERDAVWESGGLLKDLYTSVYKKIFKTKYLSQDTTVTKKDRASAPGSLSSPTLRRGCRCSLGASMARARASRLHLLPRCLGAFAQFSARKVPLTHLGAANYYALCDAFPRLFQNPTCRMNSFLHTPEWFTGTVERWL